MLSTLAQVHELIADLDDKERLVLRCVLEDAHPRTLTEDLGLSESGVRALLQRTLAKLAAAVRRQQAAERRKLGRLGAFLLPLGLSAPSGRALVEALLLRAQAWAARARAELARASEALGRALAAGKAASASVGACAGVVVALGAVEPPLRPSAPEAERTPAITRTATAAPAMPMASTLLAPAESPAAPLPASSSESATGPSSGASKGHDALFEQRSLDRIDALVETDPAAALAALELHKKAFVREQLPTERESIEERARAAAGEQRRAQDGAAPPSPPPPALSAAPPPPPASTTP